MDPFEHGKSDLSAGHGEPVPHGGVAAPPDWSARRRRPKSVK
jgi:hypothetical protein